MLLGYIYYYLNKDKVDDVVVVDNEEKEEIKLGIEKKVIKLNKNAK